LAFFRIQPIYFTNLKSFKFQARKFRGMRRTYCTLQWRGMQRSAEVGLFTKPSRLSMQDSGLSYN